MARLCELHEEQAGALVLGPSCMRRVSRGRRDCGLSVAADAAPARREEMCLQLLELPSRVSAASFLSVHLAYPGLSERGDTAYSWHCQQDTQQAREPQAPLDGGSQQPAQGAWYPVAKVLSAGDWGGRFPNSTEKALWAGEFLFAGRSSTDCRWPCGVGFPDWPEGQYGQSAP